MTLHISSHFDSGNIETINATQASNIQLNIGKDSNANFRQWFHFRLQGAEGQACCIRLLNAGASSYPKWEGYRAFASYDREEWFRVPTEFDGTQLIIRHTPEYNSIYFAYYVPYSFERHLDLIASAQLSPHCQVYELGKTLDGRDFNLLTIGTPSPHKRKVWIIARQHPSEIMAEWFIEGLLERLLDPDDALAKKLLTEAVFYIIPNMNPDGGARGHTRTNAAGIDLNRAWLAPSLEKSPEVYLVRQQMEQIGVDLFLDIHGDEQIPYVFLAGCEGVPSYSPKTKALEDQFKATFLAANPDFQTEHGYGLDEPGEANLSLANNYISETFGCLSFTLEMPFKDNANAPDEQQGWSPARCMHLGASILNPIERCLAK